MGKPRMRLYFLYSLLRPQPVSRGANYQFIHKICSFHGPALRDLALLDQVLLGQDCVSYLHAVAAGVWSLRRVTHTLPIMSSCAMMPTA